MSDELLVGAHGGNLLDVVVSSEELTLRLVRGGVRPVSNQVSWAQVRRTGTEAELTGGKRERSDGLEAERR